MALFTLGICLSGHAATKLAGFEDEQDATGNFTCMDVISIDHVHTGEFSHVRIKKESRMHVTSGSHLLLYVGISILMFCFFVSLTQRSGKGYTRTQTDKMISGIITVLSYVGLALVGLSLGYFSSAFGSHLCRPNPIAPNTYSYRPILQKQDFASGYNEMMGSTACIMAGFVFAWLGAIAIPLDPNEDAEIAAAAVGGKKSNKVKQVVEGYYRAIDAVFDMRVLITLILLCVWLHHNDSNLIIRYTNSQTLATNRTESYAAIEGGVFESNYCEHHNDESDQLFRHNWGMLDFGIVLGTITLIFGCTLYVLKRASYNMPRLFLSLTSGREFMILPYNLAVEFMCTLFVTSGLDTTCEVYAVTDPRYRLLLNIVVVTRVVNIFTSSVFSVHTATNGGWNKITAFKRAAGTITAT